ncbi:MAG: CDP-alcohol phosphatidyltransferase family protein [Flavobacteriales bacterium]|nr:CDP-alcohol phosphatidyltransferase family protein [Flavobacteriales bacterium]
MKKHLPNIITLGNLTCGLVALMFIFADQVQIAFYFMCFGLLFDFFDGFVARLLKVSGEIGKQLDSLADLVSFGVVPGFMMFKSIESIVVKMNELDELNYNFFLLPFIGFLIPILSAVRLAKFNVATNQSDQFIGLPTPANAMFFGSVAVLLSGKILSNYNFVLEIQLLSAILLVILFSLLLNANLPLIALKFKSFGWKGNEIRFTFLAACLVTILLSLLISNIFVAVPIIILLYLIISIINNITKRKNEIQSSH